MLEEKLLQKRFWEKVDIKSKDECWNWKASCTHGYGYFWNGEVTENAHRTSWIIHNGSIPKGLLVLHKCDNRKCVNPNHLYLGTHSDNNYDRAMRNPNGQGGGTPKFDSENVRIIKKLYSTGKYTQMSLAFMFNCSCHIIYRVIRSKKAYKHFV